MGGGVGYVEVGLFGAGEGGVDYVGGGCAEEVDCGGKGAVVGIVGGGLRCLIGSLVGVEGVVAAEEGGSKRFS